MNETQFSLAVRHSVTVVHSLLRSTYVCALHCIVPQVPTRRQHKFIITVHRILSFMILITRTKVTKITRIQIDFTTLSFSKVMKK